MKLYGPFLMLILSLVLASCIDEEMTPQAPDKGMDIPTIQENLSGSSTVSISTASVERNKDFKMEWCVGAVPAVCEAMKKDIDVYQCKERGEPEQLSCTARITGNSSYCAMISDPRVNSHCNALLLNESLYCESLEGWDRDWCLFDFGKNLANKDACTRISDAQMQKECFAVINLDVRSCMDAEGDYSYPCVLPIADFTGKKELCDLLEEKDMCLGELVHAR